MNKQQFFVETYGLEALERTFNNMREFKDKRNVVMAAFRKALKPTVDIMYAKTPIGPRRKGRLGGNLKKSIGLVAARGELAMFAGARIKGEYKGRHGHLLEEGTVDRFRKTKGNAPTGKLRYGGYFKRAADSTEKQAMRIVSEEWYKAIGRFIVRNNKNDRKNN